MNPALTALLFDNNVIQTTTIEKQPNIQTPGTKGHRAERKSTAKMRYFSETKKTEK